MGLSVLRELLHPQRSLWRTLLIATAAVGALLVGLLAMHSLNLESHNEVVSTQIGPSSAHHHAGDLGGDQATPSGVAALIDDCAGDCGMEHSMLGACILALTFGMLTLVGSALLSRWSAIRLTLGRLISTATATIPLPPPSLTVLSISRT